ncbi:MAG: preprotein translocase subunit SecE [Actinobacteria bacterium]|nr:preprotein translocase subunit SecE [Actinomycetota bacterium]
MKRSAVTTKPNVERVNVLAKLSRFLREVRIELTKVSWPNRPEIVASTIVVLVAVTFFALYIGGIDLIFIYLIKALSRAGG